MVGIVRHVVPDVDAAHRVCQQDDRARHSGLGEQCMKVRGNMIGVRGAWLRLAPTQSGAIIGANACDLGQIGLKVAPTDHRG